VRALTVRHFRSSSWARVAVRFSARKGVAGASPGRPGRRRGDRSAIGWRSAARADVGADGDPSLGTRASSRRERGRACEGVVGRAPPGRRALCEVESSERTRRRRLELEGVPPAKPRRHGRADRAGVQQPVAGGDVERHAKGGSRPGGRRQALLPRRREHVCGPRARARRAERRGRRRRWTTRRIPTVRARREGHGSTHADPGRRRDDRVSRARGSALVDGAPWLPSRS
jgi:hypothetical protein